MARGYVTTGSSYIINTFIANDKLSTRIIASNENAALEIDRFFAQREFGVLIIHDFPPELNANLRKLYKDGHVSDYKELGTRGVKSEVSKYAQCVKLYVFASESIPKNTKFTVITINEVYQAKLLMELVHQVVDFFKKVKSDGNGGNGHGNGGGGGYWWNFFKNLFTAIGIITVICLGLWVFTKFLDNQNAEEDEPPIVDHVDLNPNGKQTEYKLAANQPTSVAVNVNQAGHYELIANLSSNMRSRFPNSPRAGVENFSIIKNYKNDYGADVFILYFPDVSQYEFTFENIGPNDETLILQFIQQQSCYVRVIPTSIFNDQPVYHLYSTYADRGINLPVGSIVEVLGKFYMDVARLDNGGTGRYYYFYAPQQEASDAYGWVHERSLSYDSCLDRVSDYQLQ